MNKKEFEESFEKNLGEFISGIYNYCDRWCERCEYTLKCSVYALEEQRSKKSDGIPDAFIEQVRENFKLVMEMLLDLAEEKGIDLNATDTTAYEEEKIIDEFAENHILSVQSKKYSELLRKWMEENETSLLSETLKQSITLGLADEKNLSQFDIIKDAIEIINWYSFQIHVKLMWALRQGESGLNHEDSIQNDANGSAKVALIGTERSLGAWGLLYKRLPDQEDEILPILLLLGKIRKGIFTTFPNVNQFLRPGFDE